MKKSEILTEARSGAFITKVAVKDASKVYANASGELTYNPTMFQKKYVNRKAGDEIVHALNGAKQTNISHLERVIEQHEGLEMIIHIGNIFSQGIIE